MHSKAHPQNMPTKNEECLAITVCQIVYVINDLATSFVSIKFNKMQFAECSPHGKCVFENNIKPKTVEKTCLYFEC